MEKKHRNSENTGAMRPLPKISEVDDHIDQVILYADVRELA